MILGMTKSILVLDLESSSPIDLKKQGQYIYWDHPDSRCLMLGHKWLQKSDGWKDQVPHTDAAHVIDFERGGPRITPELLDAIYAPKEEVMLAAANAPFDQAGLRSMGIDTPDEKWLDVLVMAYVLGFAGRLDDVLKATPLGIKKDPQGTRCITEFSKKQIPWYENPALWLKFLGYCRGDADVEERLLRWCMQWLDTDWMAPSVRRIHKQDLIYRKINRRGIPIDRKAVAGAVAIKEQVTEQLMDDLTHTTGLENPNSVEQLRQWCVDQGSNIENLRKDTVRDEIERLPEGKVRTALTLRQELGKTSVKKFDALARIVGKGDRFRGGWQFYGASRTGRIAGRTLNPANLARPQIDDPDTVVEWVSMGEAQYLRTLFPEKPVLDTLSSCVRACLKAPPGKMWCVADLTSIESIGSAWMAGCDTVLDIFFNGQDTYKTFAAQAEGIPYEQVTKAQRTQYKVCVLGAGYMLSGRGLVAYAKDFGQSLDIKEADRQIQVFREEYHEIKQHWSDLKNAAMDAVLNPGTTFSVYAIDETLDEWHDQYGTHRTYSYKPWPRIDYRSDGTFLFVLLPSGRYLCYYKPAVERNHQVYRADGTEWFKTDALFYWGVDQKSPGAQWQRISTHAGKFHENNDQALCRDVLWNGLEKTDADPRFEITMDIYDELGTLIDEDKPELLDVLVANMTSTPDWANDRFFLGADGYVAKRYRKD